MIYGSPKDINSANLNPQMVRYAKMNPAIVPSKAPIPVKHIDQTVLKQDFKKLRMNLKVEVVV